MFYESIIRNWTVFIFYFLYLPFDRGANEQQIGAKDKPQEGGSSHRIDFENLSPV